jgi:hypothetical protein
MSEFGMSKDGTTQTINFAAELGVDLSGRRDLRLLIAQGIIEYIRARVENENKGNDGVALDKTPYSDEYVESDIFKAYGKSRNNVNMTLTGDMLGSMDILSDKDNEIVIGFDGEQNGKVEGHMTGGGNLPVRRFFGVSKDELDEIAVMFKDELDSVREEAPANAKQVLEALDALDNASNDEIIESLFGDITSP